MVEISNTDYGQAVRLLRYLAGTKGDSRREKEAARKAHLLVRKLENKKPK